jgi:hypothetical protein
MSIDFELATICKELRMLGDDELTNKALCAYAAITDSSENSRIDLSYSYVMRELRKDNDDDRRLKFQKVFKKSFDRALYEDLDDPAEIALMTAIKAINFKD